MNSSLLVRMTDLIDRTSQSGLPFISSQMSDLRKAVPDFEGKQFGPGEQPSEPHMVLALLSQVLAKVGAGGKLEGDDGRDKVVEELKVHRKRLEDRQDEVRKEQAELEREAAKYITSDDLHVGFESKTVSGVSASLGLAQRARGGS